MSASLVSWSALHGMGGEEGNQCLRQGAALGLRIRCTSTFPDIHAFDNSIVPRKGPVTGLDPQENHQMGGAPFSVSRHGLTRVEIERAVG